MIFDAYLLALANYNQSARSGIYFTALNILNEFSKNKNLDISIYSSNINEAYELKEVLQKHFPNNNFTHLYLDTISPLEFKKSELKSKYRKKKSKIIKLQLLLLSALIKLMPNNKNSKLLKDYNTYFSPAHAIPPEIKEQQNITCYTLLHDCIPILYPQYFDTDMNNYWFSKLASQLNGNDYYFTNSENTRQDFIKHFPKINPNKVTTTLLACSENFKPQKELTFAALEKYNLPTNKKYIFSLCTLEPRKNLIRAATSFIKFVQKNNIDDMVYILGGGQWNGFIEKMEKEIPEFDKYKNIILRAGYVDDKDLAPLYSGAEWFVYTSEYEGFGLPPLEAMSCGCPVITSNNSSLPEVVGNAGIMIDYDNEEQHIKAYEDYYFNKELRDSNAKLGLAHAKTFSWKKCTDKMFETMLSNLKSDAQKS